ncbi:hypothetical protein ACQP00_45020 [Dactylosporangium sp. CS-047395]|uniref:hypothetical protein n=1 Tax=Dactylosporangium sp. CS-047395 TaxID=3239936 RepID=UPI003D93465B
MDEYHRSEPFIVPTGDPRVEVFISKIADPDGANEHIEISALELRDGKPWHLCEPVRGMCLPWASADAAWRAMAELTRVSALANK